MLILVVFVGVILGLVVDNADDADKDDDAQHQPDADIGQQRLAGVSLSNIEESGPGDYLTPTLTLLLT